MWETFRKKVVCTYSMGKIRSRIKPFKAVDFARTAQEMFFEVNEALAKNNKQRLQELMSENAYQSVRREFSDKSLVWKFVKEVERPRIVHARIIPVLTKENLFAQVTVRVNAAQIFGVQHRFGKLIRGNDKTERNVIDYVVVERHIVEPSSSWRICGKVAPERVATPSN
jgi:large subunit ribosomal protein L45